MQVGDLGPNASATRTGSQPEEGLVDATRREKDADVEHSQTP